MVIFESLRRNILENWLLVLLTAIVTALVLWGVHGILYAFGKESTLTPERRKYFYGIGSIFVFCFLLFAQHITSLLQDISAASPRKGGFRAGFLALIKIDSIKFADLATNQVSTITMSGIGGTPRISEHGVQIGLIVKIDNSGQPSTAWNWKAHVEIPGGSKLEARIPGVSIQSNTIVQTVVGPFTIAPENNLISSLSVNPLPTGAGTIGWLMIHVNEISAIPEGARIVLTFEDVFSRPTKVQFVWTDPSKRN